MSRYSAYSLQPQAIPIPFHKLLKVVAVVDPGSLQVTGLIDFERALWGDPVMELQFRAAAAVLGQRAGKLGGGRSDVGARLLDRGTGRQASDPDEHVGGAQRRRDSRGSARQLQRQNHRARYALFARQ